VSGHLNRLKQQLGSIGWTNPNCNAALQHRKRLRQT